MSEGSTSVTSPCAIGGTGSARCSPLTSAASGSARCAAFTSGSGTLLRCSYLLRRSTQRERRDALSTLHHTKTLQQQRARRVGDFSLSDWNPGLPQTKGRPKLLISCTNFVIGMAGAAMVASPVRAQDAKQTATTTRPFIDTKFSDRVFFGKRSRDVFLVQVLLDRTHFSPGEIDGYYGGNTTRAIKAWQRAKGIEASGLIDATLINALKEAHPDPVFQALFIDRRRSCRSVRRPT